MAESSATAALAAKRGPVVREAFRDDSDADTHDLDYPPGAAPYDMSDMANDSIAVMNGCGLTSLPLVGMSLGGNIARRVAIRHPRSVA